MIHAKKFQCHSPTLTRMCCLPILPHQRFNGQFEDENWVSGLVLEHTKEAAEGQYRRVGCFKARTDRLPNPPKQEDSIVISPPGDRDIWPSYEAYSPEEGYTITIV